MRLLTCWLERRIDARIEKRERDWLTQRAKVRLIERAGQTPRHEDLTELARALPFGLNGERSA